MKSVTFIKKCSYIKIAKTAQQLHSAIKFVFSAVKLYKIIRNFISELLNTYSDKGHHKHQIATACLQIIMRKTSKFACKLCS